MDNKTLKNAVTLWIDHPDKAIEKYGHISNWNTENVTDMSFLFHTAHHFNDDIGNWNTSNVTTMCGMFLGAHNFDQDISRWNTENVTNIAFMFHNAFSFNQDITDWNLKNVNKNCVVLANAYAFDQNISKWNMYINTMMIQNTKLISRLNDFGDVRRSIECLYSYDRRKNYLHFLLYCGFIRYKGYYLIDVSHPLFDVEDMDKYIATFL